MNETFSEKDKQYMALALQQAEQSLKGENFPCGAVLVINDEVVGAAHNEKESKSDRISHAEMQLYIQHSKLLKKSKKENATIAIYTTLEPCLMCFGAAVMHRVDRIVVACADPLGDMSKIDGAKLGEFYAALPMLEYGLLYDESFGFIKEYLETKDTEESKHYLELFKN